MSDPDVKGDLRRYLQEAREALVWKLEGAGEYDVRRPLTPTGTNLLGLVKHLAYVEFGYFGETFGRPVPESGAWREHEDDPNWDMWATAAEARADIVALYRRAWAHSDETIGALPLDAVGSVPWWPANRRTVTLHHVLVRVLADTARHAGHADIVRELIDGSAGLGADNASMPPADPDRWSAYRDQLEQVARSAAGG